VGTVKFAVFVHRYFLLLSFIQDLVVQYLRTATRQPTPHSLRSGGQVCADSDVTVFVMQRTAGSATIWGSSVEWRDIKKLCPPLSTLATFIGAFFHFLKELGKGHESHFVQSGTPNASISKPVLQKSMWDELQDMHPKTLACSFVLTRNGKNLERILHSAHVC
jgi:hypothetical protein